MAIQRTSTFKRFQLWNLSKKIDEHIEMVNKINSIARRNEKGFGKNE